MGFQNELFLKFRGFILAKNRRHVAVAASAWTSRLISTGAQFFLVRILLDSIGVDQYAVFAVLVALAAWFNLTDFGLGLSIQTCIAEARVKGQSTKALYFFIRTLCIVLIAIFLPAFYFISPFLAEHILGSFEFLAKDDARNLFFVTSAFLSSAGISSVIFKIWYAEHKGYFSNIFPGISAVIGLVGAVISENLPPDLRLEASLASYLVPMGVLPLLVLMVQLIKSGVPALEEIKQLPFLSIIRRASGFWFLSAFSAATLQVDYLIISRFLPAEEVTKYSVIAKVFSLTFFVYNALLMAIWPVIAEFQLKGSWRDTQKLINKYIFYGVAGIAFATLILMISMDGILGILAPGKALHIPLALVACFGIYQAIRVWTDTHAVVLHSTSVMRPFWLLVPIQASLSAGLQWIFVPFLGLFGVMVGLISSFLLTVAWALPYYIRRQRADNSH